MDVKPSYIFDTGELEKVIIRKIKSSPVITYHTSNYQHFLDVRHNIKNIVEGLLNDNIMY